MINIIPSITSQDVVLTRCTRIQAHNKVGGIVEFDSKSDDIYMMMIMGEKTWCEMVLMDGGVGGWIVTDNIR